MEIIDFLIVAILVLYVVRSLARIVLPMLFQNVVNKAHQQQTYNRNNDHAKATGGVKVDHIPQAKKGTIPDSEGEFVDYEEIKEPK